MKKITLLAIAFLGMSTMVAQTQRTILYEEFTGENCGPCAGTNPSLTTFIHQAGYFPSKIILLRYQCNIPSAPGAGSLYVDNSAEEQVRQTYYTVPFAPYARFDGIVLKEPVSQGTGSDGHAVWIEQPYYPNIVPDSAINNSPFAITVTHMFNAAFDSVTVTAVITAAQSYTSTSAGSLKLQVALTEQQVHFAAAPGTNGEKDFYDVMRKMVPNASGTALNNTWATTNVQTITQKIKIPTYIHDKNTIGFVAFVQEDGNKRVHNSAFSTPQSVNVDASVASINTAAVLCTTTITPATTIMNSGATTMTTCVVNYKLDAGATMTYTWTGSLVTGATAIVTLPNIVSTSGSHTLTVNTSLPNTLADQNTGNDKKITKLIIQATSTSAPIVEGFVSATFPPTNWAIFNPDGGTYTWKRNTASGGYGTTTNSTYIQFYNNANAGDRDELYMPKMDLTVGTSPQLSFDYAYNYYTDANGDIYDSLAVMASDDCGTTWTTLFVDGGVTLATAAVPGLSTAYVPATTEWKTQNISLNAFASSTALLVKFVGINGYGNNLLLDNINIAVTTGIKSTTGNIANVSVFPNPAVSNANVKVSLSTSEKVTINLYSAIGQNVFSQTYELQTGDNNVNISTDKLANGIYSVLVNTEKGTYQTKLTVSK
jgi:hypothetical protein